MGWEEEEEEEEEEKLTLCQRQPEGNWEGQ